MNNAKAATADTNAAAKDPNKVSNTVMPKFSTAPRYRLLEKAFLSAVKVKRGRSWIPYDDVLLDPTTQPMATTLSGDYDSNGDPDRVPLEIEFEGIPDDHMEPMNEAAEWMMDHVDQLKAEASTARNAATKARRRNRNPIDDLTIVGQGAVLATAGQ